MNGTWKKYAGTLNSLTDEQIEFECESARNDMANAKEWLEAVASWEAAGKPSKAALEENK